MIVLRSDSGETHVRRHATWGMYDEMLELVDRAYVIHGGKVLFVGKPQELLHHDEVRRLYLGENYED